LAEILCSGVLFDLDGVLVDSTPAVIRVWGSWAKERGFDPEKTVRQAHGQALRPCATCCQMAIPKRKIWNSSGEKSPTWTA
jgi:beta-phosphoglucomutase-like phosphatase (HAD superfamily)